MPVITTKTLEFAYEDDGPKNGPSILLLHGWPDDASTWVQVAAALNKAGFRTIAPTWRGFGATRFRNPEQRRTGNRAVLAMDAMDLMNALEIEKFAVVGHDWGSNAGEAIVVGWPERVTHLAQLSSPPRLGELSTPSFEHAQLCWYHWFMATRRGAVAVRKKPREFAHIMWVNWAPAGWFEESTFDAVAKSWENPDWVDVTLHSYQARWGEATFDESSEWLEQKAANTKQLALPALYIQGEEDGVNPPFVSEKVGEKFSGPFERVLLPGVGHFPTREAPDAVAAQLIQFLR